MVKSQACADKSSPKVFNGLTQVILYAIIGFVASGTTISGGMSPVNVAVVSFAGILGGLSCFAASLVSYIFNSSVFYALPQIASMGILLVVKFITMEKKSSKVRAGLCAVMTGFIMVSMGVVITIVTGFSVRQLILSIAMGLLCGCLVYFLNTAYKVVKKEGTLSLAGTAGASLAVIYVLSIATLTAIDFSKFNIGRIIGVLVVLLGMRKYKHMGGAIAGVLTSCGIVLCSPTLGRSTMLLAVSGLIAGLFVDRGTIPVISAFLITNVAGLVAIGVTSDTLSMIIDVAVATSIYVIIPSAVWSKMLSSIGVTHSDIEVMAQTASEKLKFASNTVEDVRSSIKKVAVAMEKHADSEDLSSMVCESLCSRCRNNMLCWEESQDDMKKAFHDIESIMKLTGKISYTDFPKELAHCTKKSLLESDINVFYNQIYYNSRLRSRTREMQTMVSDQFSAMGEMLDSLASQMECYTMTDNYLTREVTTFFVKKGLPQAKVCVYYNTNNNLMIEVYIPLRFRFDKKDLADSISSIVEKDIDEPRYSTIGGLTKIEMWEKPLFSLDTGASQLPGKPTEITGDSYEVFTDNDTESYIVLSDGMGSGKRAQLDSLLTCSMISRLIRAGIGFMSALRLINGSLRVKGWEESFATVDISAVNLCTGSLKIVKAGASATYLVRGEQLKKVDARSLPIGIIQDTKPAVIDMELLAEDVLITASDGVVENSLETIRQIAVNNKTMCAKDLSKKMLKAARTFGEREHIDDITIIVTKVLKNV